MKKTAPCKREDGSDCPDRTRNCHDTCEKYLEWQQRRRAEKSVLARENAMRKTVEDMHAASIRRTKYGGGRKRG